MYICDLYERIQRFKILCRINYLGNCTSMRGQSYLKMILIDEKGDEILCMLFDGESSER